MKLIFEYDEQTSKHVPDVNNNNNNITTTTTSAMTME